MQERYEGEQLNQLRHGLGTYHYANAFFTYTGQWYQGKKHGVGVLKLGDSGEYSGSFEHGKIQGEGTRRWSNGDEYTGNWEDGERVGFGVMTSKAGGWRYEGNWHYGQRQGQGRLTYANGDVYIGEFAKHHPHGTGILTTASNDVYTGTWEQGSLHGLDVDVKYANGSNFRGEFRHGQRHSGRYFDSHTGMVYDGTWRDDCPAAIPTVLVPTAADSAAALASPAAALPGDPGHAGEPVTTITMHAEPGQTLSVLRVACAMEGSQDPVKQESGRVITVSMVSDGSADAAAAAIAAQHGLRPSSKHAKRGSSAKLQGNAAVSQLTRGATPTASRSSSLRSDVPTTRQSVTSSASLPSNGGSSSSSNDMVLGAGVAFASDSFIPRFKAAQRSEQGTVEFRDLQLRPDMKPGRYFIIIRDETSVAEGGIPCVTVPLIVS